MGVRILTLAVPDGRQFYAVCGDCGFLSMPLSEWELAKRAGGRHVCRVHNAAQHRNRAS